MDEAMNGSENEPATKADLHALRSKLRSDFDALRSDVHAEISSSRISADARFDAHDRRLESVEGNLRRLNIGFARMEGDMTEVKAKLDGLLTIKEDFARFSARLDRTMNFFESTMRKMDSQGSMLMEHEGRITKLETRPS
jgi:outer membrane murein-binding lipoprotein Lpp